MTGCQRIYLERKKMFQGPTGYIEQMWEVHLQYGTVQQNGGFTRFST